MSSTPRVRALSARPQTMLIVADVEASSDWYQAALGATSGHGGHEYERLLVDDVLVLQLHAQDADHQHGALRDIDVPPGNGVILWFAVDAFDEAVDRLRAMRAEIVTDVHVNPNAGHREIWVRDPDGYAVVIAEGMGGL